MASLLGGSIPPLYGADIGLPYEVSFEGVIDGRLLSAMKDISDTLALKQSSPATMGLLKRRIDRDTQRFLQFLKAEGYYGAEVRADLDSKAEPLRIIFRVDTGPPYILKTVDFQFGVGGDEVPEPGMPDAKQIGLGVGKPFKARAVVDAQKEILRGLKGKGFPFPKVEEPRVIVDHAIQSVSVTYQIDPGPQAKFGPTELTGIGSVDEAYVRRKIPWKEDDLFDADLFEELRRRITGSGLFATVRISTAERLDERGRLPVTVALTERKHRSVGAGVSYKTDEGPGVKLSWEHRNLFHRGERLGLSATISNFTLSAEGVFRKPEFLRDDQSLRLSLRLAEDDTDAYTSRYAESSVSIDRNLTKKIRIGAGLGLKTSKVTQLGDEESFTLLSLPLYFERDTSDDLLDPGRGGRLALQVTPFDDPFGGNLPFAKGSLRYRHYLQLLRTPSVVMAGGVHLGAIEGAERNEIPADERFYAGGGGSIRGYAYQSVAPLSGVDPIGGRSIIELSLEFRLKLTQRFGLVTFLDGGNAFTTKTPDFGESLLWGTGLGLRYYTPIGPLRLDVAFPLDRREGVDDSFQVYVSLGQAF